MESAVHADLHIKTEWAIGWKSLVSATLGVSVTALAPASIGVVLTPLATAFGWSRTVVTMSVFILAICTLLLAPVAGSLIARWGARRVALTSIALSAFGFVGFALAGGPSWTWLAAAAFHGILTAAVGPIVWATGITSIFNRNRGLALSIMLSGIGIAFIVAPVLAIPLMEAYGWRAVYLAFAAIVLLVHFPVVWLGFGRGVLPTTAPAPGVSSEGPGIGGALHLPRFWLLGAFAILVGAVEGAFVIHLFPILQEGGVDPKAIALIASSLGLALIVGRLLSGVLLDRISPDLVMASMIIALASATLLAWFMGEAVIGALAMVMALGFGCGGTVSGMAFLVGRYFDLRSYPAVYGTLVGAFGVCYGLAPAVASYAREQTGSYQAMFPFFLGTLVVALIVFMTFTRNAKHFIAQPA